MFFFKKAKCFYNFSLIIFFLCYFFEIFIQNALYDGEYKIDKIMLEDISLEFEEIKLLAYNKIEQGV